MTRRDSIGHWFARKGWVHLTLLSAVGIFIFPFVWMVGMSMKTDDEAVSGQLLPAVPVFRADSPVIRPPITPQQPQDVTTTRWKTLLPQLLHEAHARLPQTPPTTAGNVNIPDLRDAAAQELTAKTIDKLPEKLWAQGDGAVITGFEKLLDQPDGHSEVTGAVDAQLARLEFLGLSVHSTDAEIFNIAAGDQIARQWHVESGPGELLPAGKDSSYLQYHFASSSDAPVVLRADFDAHVTPENLQSMVVSIKGDDSWQKIDATLDLGNQRWKSGLTYYVAQYRPASIIFQPPSFDDTSGRPRVWIPLSPDGHAVENAGPTHATLRLVISPSSTLGAIYGKVQRNYQRAFRAVPFWTYVFNSVLLVALETAGALLSAAFVAYAFARLSWPGRSIAFGILLSTMMLPSQITLIPSFVIWRSLGWFNTLNPLWVPAWFGSAFFIFLMTQNMKTIPRELEEAARIDGLNAIQTWWYIILPLVKPTLAAIAIMVFMGAWNDFLGPLIMLRDQARFPLSLGLFGLQIDQKGDFTLIMAGNMIMTVPVILIFFLFQRYFIEGVTVSGMKG
jgi:ABC-type glycerol-3-phosphate transport system permease component